MNFAAHALGTLALAVATLLPLPGAAIAQQDASATLAPAEHRRGPEQTFLTYPEWFLVHSPAEYAEYVREHPPSDFPFFGHIKQFWSSYRAITGETAQYPFNFGYHVMIMVIGVSTTVEYVLRSAYETLVGRLTELTVRGVLTEEDRYGAAVAQDYVDFIRVRPWYEYDFAGKLASLWRQTSLWGPDALRKWERKYALTTEYGIKAVYGAIIARLTKASYEEPLPVTAVVVDRLPEDAPAALPELRVLSHLQSGGALVTLPRYAAFTTAAIALARRGVNFVEVAGNRGDILVTLLAPRGPHQTAVGRVLFEQPILTQPPLGRIALVVPVTELGALLASLDGTETRVEHIYDY